MAAYMKHRFPFYGIQAPVRKSIFREVKNSHPIDPSNWKTLASDCFDKPEREWHYMALEVVDASKKYWEETDIEFLEKLIVKNSWWDSVDWLAGTIGRFFRKYPNRILDKTRSWNQSQNMWLIRVSILFQLHEKEKTDWPLLQGYIINHKDSKEFFIQKAQGWALRQYAKVNPSGVLDFLSQNADLSNLTKREATKHLK